MAGFSFKEPSTKVRKEKFPGLISTCAVPVDSDLVNLFPRHVSVSDQNASLGRQARRRDKDLKLQLLASHCRVGPLAQAYVVL